MDCIFCTIVAGDIPNYTIYEDEHVLAFLDIHPRSKGHTLVIPKKHAHTIFDLSSEDMKQLFAAVQTTTTHINTVLSPDGYNIGWNHAEAGGQEVPHVHIHIMPRWTGDGGGNMHSIINNPGDESVEAIAQKFQDAK